MPKLYTEMCFIEATTLSQGCSINVSKLFLAIIGKYRGYMFNSLVEIIRNKIKSLNKDTGLLFKKHDPVSRVIISHERSCWF